MHAVGIRIVCRHRAEGGDFGGEEAAADEVLECREELVPDDRITEARSARVRQGFGALMFGVLFGGAALLMEAVSLAPMFGTDPNLRPVAGLTTSMVFDETASDHCPSIRQCCLKRPASLSESAAEETETSLGAITELTFIKVNTAHDNRYNIVVVNAAHQVSAATSTMPVNGPRMLSK